MDMKKLLEAVTKFAGEPEQKPGDQVRGTEKAKTSGKDHPFKGRLVGASESILNDLDKVSEEKSLEWQLAEAYAKFLEDNLGVEEKRPARKGSRPARDMGKTGEPSKRYTKVDEATRDEDWQGWKIRYETTPKFEGQPLRWMTWNVKRGTESAHEGSANSPQEAIEAAKQWILSGGNAKEIDTSRNLTIDFNAKFVSDILNGGKEFFAKIEAGPVLVVSDSMLPGFSRTYLGRSKKDQQLQLPSMVLSGAQAKEVGLKANGRYILGDTRRRADGALLFPLIYQSTVQSKSDKIHMTKPGLTVAAPRTASGLEEENISQAKVNKFHAKLDKLVHSTFGRREEEMKESLRPGEYHTHTVTFDDGTQGKINVPSDEFSEQQIKDFYAKKGKNVVKVDWDYSVRGDSFSGRDDYDYNRLYAPPGIYENAEELDVGDDVIITGPVQYKGATGVIEGFGKDKRFVMVNLYNYGRQSFHSSDVSFNEYADSEEEEQDWRDRGLSADDDYDSDDLHEGIPLTGEHRFRSLKSFIKATDHLGLKLEDDGEEVTAIDPTSNAILGAFSRDENIGWVYAPSTDTDTFKALEEGWESGPDERAPRERDPDWEYDQRRQEKMDIEAEAEPKKITYKLIGRGPNQEPNWDFGLGEFDTQEEAVAARSRLMADPDTPNPRDIGIQEIHRRVAEGRDTPLLDKDDYTAKRKALHDLQADPHTAKDSELSAEVIRRLAGLRSQAKDMGLDVDESRGHKIIARRLADIERRQAPVAEPTVDELKRREEQAKADYREYVAKMKKKNPNYIPLYKIDEYGANEPTGTAGGSTATINNPINAKAVAQATQTLKSATGSTAPTTSIAKALNSASQGTSVNATDMKAIEPLMKDMVTIASDPKLAGQYKTLASQVNQAQKLGK